MRPRICFKKSITGNVCDKESFLPESKTKQHTGIYMSAHHIKLNSCPNISLCGTACKATTEKNSPRYDYVQTLMNE